MPSRATRLIHLVLILGLTALCVPLLGISVSELTKYLGLKTVTVEVAGTGSMYPSLYWDQSEGGPEDPQTTSVPELRTSPRMFRRFPGITMGAQRYFYRPLGYGDLVAFSNARTRAILETEGKDPQIGFIKRVIGLPGDTIELRDGYVYRDGIILDEPYIRSPRSTYGGDGLADCTVLTIPPGQYFVLGDNRKVSTDSRLALGLVSDADIHFVLPYADQAPYHSLWRDTTKDKDLLGAPTLSKAEFYAMVSNLKPRAALEKSAQLRGTALLKNSETSYSLKQSVQDSGYHNIVLGEFVSHGHYTAEELLQNLLAFPDTAAQIKSHDYQDIGVSIVTREINGCPTQVIVGHLGGYIPASYAPSVVESWVAARDSLNQILPSWEKAVGYNNVDQIKLSELLTLLHRRQALASEVVSVMQAKEWINDALAERIKADTADTARIEQLSRELNL